MSDPRRIGEASSYDQLIVVYRARMGELGLTFETLDYLSGLQPGYSSKLLGPLQGRTIGQVSMGLLNRTLAVKFLLIEDLEAAREMETKWERRDKPPNPPPLHASREASLGKTTMRRVFSPVIKELSRRGNVARQEKLNPETRQRIARKAGRARWRQARLRARETNA